MNSKFIKPSDAKAWALCHRRVWLDNQPGVWIESDDPFEQLIIEMGLAHEKEILAELEKSFTVVNGQSVSKTKALMDSGVDVIYQGHLRDSKNKIIGNPDFLIRNGSGKYQAADAKLALNENKKEIQAQLGLYRRMLGNDLPAIVFRGDRSQALIDENADNIVDGFVDDMRKILSEKFEPKVRYSHSKCRACPYYLHCRPGFEKKQDTSLLYGVEGRAAESLEKDANIHTITELSRTKPEAMPEIKYLKSIERKTRAVHQAKSILDGEVFKLNDFTLPDGTWIHFDIEDNPLTPSGEKHVYLWGFLNPDYSELDYQSIWTDSEEQDYEGWIKFLELIEEYRKDFSDLVLAHYSNHEVTTIKQYAVRYEMENHPTVEHLLGDNSPLFDLLEPIRANLVLPLDGYGLKDICKHKDLVNFHWQDSESGSLWSVVQFNEFLDEARDSQRGQIKIAILDYNYDDVRATRALEIWLRRKFIDTKK